MLPNLLKKAINEYKIIEFSKFKKELYLFNFFIHLSKLIIIFYKLK